MEALDDPYSEYYTAEELNELTEQTQGIYYGIGAYVSMDSDTNLPKISGVIEGAPAADVDLRANDIIYEVDGVSTAGIREHDPRRSWHHGRSDDCQTGRGRLSARYGRESKGGESHRQI